MSLSLVPNTTVLFILPILLIPLLLVLYHFPPVSYSCISFLFFCVLANQLFRLHDSHYLLMNLSTVLFFKCPYFPFFFLNIHSYLVLLYTFHFLSLFLCNHMLFWFMRKTPTKYSNFFTYRILGFLILSISFGLDYIWHLFSMTNISSSWLVDVGGTTSDVSDEVTVSTKWE